MNGWTLFTFFNATLFILTVALLIWAHRRGHLLLVEPDDSQPTSSSAASITESYSLEAEEELELEEAGGDDPFDEGPETWLDLPEEFLDLGEWR